MTKPYLPSHLSPSQLSCYALCPAIYHERYVQKIYPPPEPERLFGIVVHPALEAHYRGEDDEMTFLQSWRESLAQLDQSLYPIISNLKRRGLELLSQVRALKLSGEPERHITVLAAGISIPIIGFVDLWADNLIVDFKTAGYGWTQAKADAQIFQPAIYSQAYALERDGHLPQFQFIVLPRIDAPIQILDASRSYGQIYAMFEQARTIHEAIESQQFECACNGRYHLLEEAA
jgi:PD-(D/E)XK nuclease superfamily